MRLRTIACALTAAMLLVLSVGSAAATTAPRHLQKLAQQQTNLLLKFYKGQNVSPLKCGEGQGSDGVDGVFLLPALSFAPGDQTLHCKTTARKVLVDLGGFVLTEDDRFPESSYPLNGPPPAEPVPFTRKNLEPICDDIIAQGFLGDPVPATLDGDPITGPRKPLNSGVFTAEVNPEAPTFYADSEDLGHPGRLATVYCGYKAKVHLRPGTHTIVVDYSRLFRDDNPATEDPSAVFTYNITVKAHDRSH
jgi:hypothetical protein